jgi:hypothetical protein
LRDVAPLTDRQVEETRRLLELGEIDVVVLRDALSTSLGAKLEILEATLVEARASDALQQMLRPRWITPPLAGTEEEHHE